MFLFLNKYLLLFNRNLVNNKFLVHYLNGDKTVQEIKVGGLDGIDYNHKLFSEAEAIINLFRELNLKTNTWTVNEWNMAEYLIR